MTRKEELRKIADDLVCDVYSRVDNDGDMNTVSYESCLAAHVAALQQVEREVIERVEKQAREFSVLYPMDVWRDSSKKDMTARIMVSFADWLRNQQKELG